MLFYAELRGVYIYGAMKYTFDSSARYTINA